MNVSDLRDAHQLKTRWVFRLSALAVGITFVGACSPTYQMRQARNDRDPAALLALTESWRAELNEENLKEPKVNELKSLIARAERHRDDILYEDAATFDTTTSWAIYLDDTTNPLRQPEAKRLHDQALLNESKRIEGWEALESVADRCRECGVAITVKPAKDEACERRHQRIVEILNRDPESFYSQYVGTESVDFKTLDALWTFNTRCARYGSTTVRAAALLFDHIRKGTFKPHEGRFKGEQTLRQKHLEARLLMLTTVVDGLAPLDDALTRLADRRIISSTASHFELAVKGQSGLSRPKRDLTVAFEVGCSATVDPKIGEAWVARYPNYFGACAASNDSFSEICAAPCDVTFQDGFIAFPNGTVSTVASFQKETSKRATRWLSVSVTEDNFAIHNRKHLASSHFEKDVPDWSKSLGFETPPEVGFRLRRGHLETYRIPVTWQNKQTLMASVVDLNDGLIDRVMKRRAEADKKWKRLKLKTGSRSSLTDLGAHPIFGERIAAVLSECDVVGDKQRDCKKAMVAVGTVIAEYVKVHQHAESYLQGLYDTTCSGLASSADSCQRIVTLQATLLEEVLGRFQDPKIDQAIGKLKRAGDAQRAKNERARIKAEKAAAKAAAKRLRKWKRSKTYKACVAACEDAQDGCPEDHCAMPESF